MSIWLTITFVIAFGALLLAGLACVLIVLLQRRFEKMVVIANTQTKAINDQADAINTLQENDKVLASSVKVLQNEIRKEKKTTRRRRDDEE